ncbi:tetratricopeptide repeat protein [Planktothrix sp. FACHB-1365]|uniref:tetratricopeptide repeat protein n=1 Tax=Planktothrix sp. FACHB-1365 TaxID=2692855 RepID=UPI001689BA13|nr:tetratricopeptide repeat protein [Planktothrix sp. FACHB-1365]MBD2484124.1 tetratricopeptide repeat protein [Planktothrix sp. FACHB-1365]
MPLSDTPEKTVFDLHAEAHRYIAQQQFDEAVEVCQQALKLQPRFLPTYSTMGLAKQLQGKLDEAKFWYTKALDLKPDWVEVHANLGTVYVQQQQWQEALQSYQTALHFKPNQAIIYQNLYRVWINLNQPEEANHAWFQALILEPQCVSPQDYMDFGKTLIEKGKLDQALELYTKGVEIYPNWPHSYFSLGEALSRKQQWDEAIAAYNQAISLDSNSNLFYQSLGDALVQQKQWEEAIANYQKAIELSPNFSWTYHQLGNALSEQQRWEEATLAYYQGIALNPKFFGSYFKLGEICSKTGKHQEAVDWYCQAIEINPDSFWLHFTLGNSLLEMQQFEEALTSYQQAIELEPNIDWLYPQIGKLFTGQKQWNQAIDAYCKAVELNPNNLWLLDQLADTLIEQEEIETAISVYQKCLEVTPKAHVLHYQLGNLYNSQGQIDEAIASYQTAINLNSKVAEYYAGLGEAWLKKQELDLAMSYLMDALQMKPDLIEAYQNIAKILQQQGKTEEALKCYNYKELPWSLLEQYCSINPDQLITSDFSSHVTYIPVYPASQISLNPSRTIAQFHPGFIFGQAETRNAFVVILENGKVWGDSATSAIMTAQNELLTDISTGCAELVLSSNKLPPAYKIDGTVAFLSVQWGEAFYHWLYDVLPGIHLIQESGISLDSIDYFVFNSYRSPYQKQTLQKLGIPESKIIESRYQPYIQAQKIIVPAPNFFHNSTATSPWICKFLKQQFVSQDFQKISTNRRIYISREQASYRHLVNQDELLKRLEPLNFESVVLESLTISEQAELMASASVVLTPHGAGLSNIVFCQPGTKVIELFAPTHIPPCYRIISNICELEHYYLIGELVENEALDDITFLGLLDMRINIDDLMCLLELAGVTKPA